MVRLRYCCKVTNVKRPNKIMIVTNPNKTRRSVQERKPIHPPRTNKKVRWKSRASRQAKCIERAPRALQRRPRENGSDLDPDPVGSPKERRKVATSSSPSSSCTSSSLPFSLSKRKLHASLWTLRYCRTEQNTHLFKGLVRCHTISVKMTTGESAVWLISIHAMLLCSITN